MRLLVVSLVVFACYAPLRGFAASFDCAHAAAPREQTICADKALSALDDKLNHDYRAALARLTPNGANLLRQAQREWLGFIAVVCPITKPEASQDNPSLTPAECLTRAYDDRIEALVDSGKQIGPFTFVRIDHFAAERAPNGSGTLPNLEL